MRSIKSTGISNEKFAPWLRRELARALKLGLVLLVAGGAVIWGLTAASPAFEAGWTNFNYRLSGVALDQHPLALARTFASRLRESEYGWTPLSLGTPFNVTAAREALRRAYPEVTGVFDGVPQVPRGARLRAANPARYELRTTAFLQRYRQIEAGRFSSLYDRDDLFSAPNANVKLGLFVTKIFGLPDAFLFTAGTILDGGGAGVVLFGTVLALTAMPLWRSRRPARTWLKLLAWPGLASALVWAAILVMALSAAAFGGLTPNTSALALFATLPLLSVIARLPLHLAETLVATPPKWDGTDRRKPRPIVPPGPPPKPGETIPPWGGA
ncbi:hypothetical protein [Opitutus sp. GAS368]|uniref:hypothetical protein n=1 Tax=Opitutus sp. GAS368 TaxID=1882749 RepID=UPI0008793E98|nr:hypothetical protein [Opitutus sp. GAS368]SDS06927.1 hypothetical protein SAMN05444173_1791 [Opitutus sp. GAS368]